MSLAPTDPCSDYLEELFDIVASLTFYSPKISANQWSLFDRLIQAACGFGIDFLQCTYYSYIVIYMNIVGYVYGADVWV